MIATPFSPSGVTDEDVADEDADSDDGEIGDRDDETRGPREKPSTCRVAVAKKIPTTANENKQILSILDRIFVEAVVDDVLEIVIMTCLCVVVVVVVSAVVRSLSVTVSRDNLVIMVLDCAVEGFLLAQQQHHTNTSCCLWLRM